MTCLSTVYVRSYCSFNHGMLHQCLKRHLTPLLASENMLNIKFKYHHGVKRKNWHFKCIARILFLKNCSIWHSSYILVIYHNPTIKTVLLPYHIWFPYLPFRLIAQCVYFLKIHNSSWLMKRGTFVLLRKNLVKPQGSIFRSQKAIIISSSDHNTS